MATNAKKDESKEENKSQTEDERTEEIKKAKAKAVESETTDESQAEGDDKESGGAKVEQIDDSQEDSEKEEKSEKEESTFTKGEGFDWVKADNPVEYARELERAYTNSTSEVLKWKKKAEEVESGKKSDPSAILRQANLREEKAMEREYEQFVEHYPQMKNRENFEKFEKRVISISEAIQKDEQREPSFNECMNMAAITLGWKPDTSEKVGSAIKSQAASSPKSSPTSPPAKSKVTSQMIENAKKYFPGKSDAELIKELEPHVS